MTRPEGWQCLAAGYLFRFSWLWPLTYRAALRIFGMTRNLPLRRFPAPRPRKKSSMVRGPKHPNPRFSGISAIAHRPTRPTGRSQRPAHFSSAPKQAQSNRRSRAEISANANRCHVAGIAPLPQGAGWLQAPVALLQLSLVAGSPSSHLAAALHTPLLSTETHSSPIVHKSPSLQTPFAGSCRHSAVVVLQKSAVQPLLSSHKAV